MACHTSRKRCKSNIQHPLWAIGRNVLQVNMHRFRSQIFNLLHTFKMSAMMSVHSEKCCHLASAHEASALRICSSARQFPIYSTSVLVCPVNVRYCDGSGYSAVTTTSYQPRQCSNTISSQPRRSHHDITACCNLYVSIQNTRYAFYFMSAYF